MFPLTPLPENFSIRLQVNWCDQKRPVEVRLERWPKSHDSVMVCRFEDAPEDGEWIVLGAGLSPYRMGNPRTESNPKLSASASLSPYKMGDPLKALFNRQVNLNEFDIATRQPLVSWEVKEERLEKLKRLVRRAFEGDNCIIGRVLQMPDLPDEPRLMLWSSSYSLWRHSWNDEEPEATCFQWCPSPPHLNEEGMSELLKSHWHDAQFEPRFAWDWSRWSDDERVGRCTGFGGASDELPQIMTWILSATQKLWTLGEGWSWKWWNFRAEDRPFRTSVYSHSDDWQAMESVEEEKLLQRWEEVLLSHFIPAWRGDWLKKHLCVRQFWQSSPRQFIEVSMTSPPTMHERLEARLHLRDWLEHNAPDRMNLLPS